MKRTFSFCTVALLAASLCGCGYTLQHSQSRELEIEGVQRIYVQPVVNNSYKSGVENLIYNALLKNLSANRWLVLVRDPVAADAVLQGTVNTAQFVASASVTGNNLNPAGKGLGDRFTNIAVATEYLSTLSCSFNLVRRGPAAPGKKATLWSASFVRAKPFPASNQLGTLGETSSLINDSEFDRTLREMAQSMMDDVRESMLARF